MYEMVDERIEKVKKIRDRRLECGVFRNGIVEEGYLFSVYSTGYGLKTQVF
jgi:hypothetical protein